jgi:hypothetical protein
MQGTYWSTMSDIVQHIIGVLLSPPEVQRWSSVSRTFASTLSATALWQLACYDVSANATVLYLKVICLDDAGMSRCVELGC